MFLAHSSDPARGVPAQDYAAHVGGVVRRATKAADEADRYASCDAELLRKIVPLAAEFHDLGKLDEENQDVLSGKRKARKLPIQHTDAGTAYLLDKLKVVLSAALVRSHHIGLPDFIEEQNRAEKFFRDDNVLEVVNRTLSGLIKLHEKAFGSTIGISESNSGVRGDASLFFRIALSCLADGDHSDTAIHYQNQTVNEPIVALRPADRLAALDRYVMSLKTDDDRSRQRSDVYLACRNSDVRANIVSCDSPVGTGKTTAVLAHLLSQAQKRKLRRVIVVLPFTNIITQSVEVYRKALVLPGENPEQVIAELHHRADFQDIHSRQFTALWKAPIIVTTAVNFFETLASNTPSTLRRLHNLPGSAVFIDESHAALPAKLLPLAWRWIKALANEWGCYWVLASGSLNRFWKIEEFDKEKPDIPEILPMELRSRLAQYEKGRISYQFHDTRLTEKELVAWVASLPGPRIVILNTVQSAAVVAREHEKSFKRSSVEHLSTALTPSDRDRTLDRIKSRLSDPNDTKWTLIATSCVEAGVDLSFKTGVREAASLVSLLQTAGRVNRHHPISVATVWTIVLKEEGLLKSHPGMSDSSKVLLELISERCAISPDLCTNALKREIRLAGAFSDSLLKSEEGLRFPQVEKDFRVIASDTRTVVVDAEMVKRLEDHSPVDWRDIQKASVQIWGYRLDDLRIPEVLGHPGMYKWSYAYNDFIGYMAGILPVEAFKQGSGSVCVI
ncbi:MAG: DEAD/DEAH box helicase family protein [Thermodesulfobacteriota bacterium]|nr:DEAD/DEAH box helicase family protein [Thermodesulfobacteriota bacterium]